MVKRRVNGDLEILNQEGELKVLRSYNRGNVGEYITECVLTIRDKKRDRVMDRPVFKDKRNRHYFIHWFEDRGQVCVFLDEFKEISA